MKAYPKSVLAAVLICMAILKAEASVLMDADSMAITGRWNLTLIKDGQERPSWLEIRHSGYKSWVGYFVSYEGSVRPVSKININGDQFDFTIPAQWEKGKGTDVSVAGTIEGERMRGTVSYPDGSNSTWTAVRAPSLRREKQPTWGKPITLIQNNSLKGWSASGANQWVVENGILKSPKSGSNLFTDEKFTDFKLHIEFRYPKNGNSGVYLRGRYEVQIADSKDKGALPLELGGVYGFIPPNEQVAKAPGEWQTYDITLIGRMITVVANGKTIISNVEIPGTTGGAIDSKEGEPGPILLQGDHEPIEFRNIVITPAK